MPPRRRRRDDGVDQYAGMRFRDLRNVSEDSSSDDDAGYSTAQPVAEVFADNKRKQIVGGAVSKHVFDPNNPDSSSSSDDGDEDDDLNDSSKRKTGSHTHTSPGPAALGTRAASKRRRGTAAAPPTDQASKSNPSSQSASASGKASSTVQADVSDSDDNEDELLSRPKKVARVPNAISQKIQEALQALVNIEEDGEADDTTDISMLSPDLPPDWNATVIYPAREEPFVFGVTPSTCVYDIMKWVATEIGLDVDHKQIEISVRGRVLGEWDTLANSAVSHTDVFDACIKNAEAFESIQSGEAQDSTKDTVREPHVQIRVRSSADARNSKLHVYKIPMATKLSVLREQFANHQNITKSSVTLMFDGERIQDSQTPNSLDLEAGEEVQFEAKFVAEN